MIKFTDEFIEKANYLYRLAERYSGLSIHHLDKTKCYFPNVIFRTRFNMLVDFLGDKFNRPVIISAIKNYLIGLSYLNENAQVREFIDGIDLS
jgi:hypothetical protein